MSTPLAIPSNIDELTGPLLLGYLLNAGLYGILIIQVYMYYLGFPNDKTGIKILVYTLFAFDTIQTALTTHNAWHFLGAGWGDVAVLNNPGWSWIAVPLFSGIVSASVQIFFAWRIHILGSSTRRRPYIPCLVIVLAVAQGACALTSGIRFQIIGDVTKIGSLFPTATVWLGGSALNDLIITLSMSYFLASSHTGFAKTDAMLSRLVRLTCETGTLTTLAATIDLILFLKFKENNLHMIPAVPLAKLYTNSLMCTLNCRLPMTAEEKIAKNDSNGDEWTSRSRHTRTQTVHHSTSKAGVQITTVREIIDDDGVAMVTLPRTNSTAKDMDYQSSTDFDQVSEFEKEKVKDLESGTLRHAL